MNQYVAKAKTHVQENKKIYLVGSTCLIVGLVSGYFFHNTAVSTSIRSIRLWSPGDNNLMSIYITPLGDPGNVIQCVETGTIYASQGQAARELGITASALSQHLAGKKVHVRGNHFRILGKAGEVLAE
jgi:hypothetical protein